MSKKQKYSKILIDLHYLPSIPYFEVIAKSSEVILDISSAFQKQSYQSRAHIRNAQGLQKLIIPTQHPRMGVPYEEIKIDYSVAWWKEHMRSLQAAYNNAPYGETLLEEMIFPVLREKISLLVEFNLDLLKQLFFFMGIEPNLSIMKKEVEYKDIVDMRGVWHPKKPLPIGSKSRVYSQRFLPFIPNLSVVDLIACEGRFF